MNQQKEQGLNVIDLFYYLLGKWPWFLVSVAICATYAWYQYSKAEEVYFRTATVIIKGASDRVTTVGFDQFNSLNKINITNEILQFRSMGLMEQVVRRLNADIDYKVEDGLRQRELYSQSPVSLTIEDGLPDRYFAFTVVPIDSTHVYITDLVGMNAPHNSYKVELGRTALIGNDKIQLNPTTHYGPRWREQPVRVVKKPLSAVVGYFLSNLGIRQEHDEGSILTISVRDSSPLRAADIIHTLVGIYNEEALQDKNQVAVNTAEFINERLIIIEKELSDVESDIQHFKQANLIDGSSSDRHVGNYVKYDEAAIEQETKLNWAQYIREYLTDPTKARDLLPTNTGLGEGGIEAIINQYNTVKIKRERLADDSGEANPVLEEMDNTLHQLRQSAIRSIDNLIVSLNVKHEDARSRQQMSQARASAMPAKERTMQSIERQHKIKETLYLFLLNRREENALSQAMADNNARMIDSAHGPGGPIAPRRNNILMVGVLVGLAIPLVYFLLRLFLDTKVHGRRDLEGKLTVPYLGEIPFDKKIAKGKAEETDDGTDIVTEAFRILRTNMTFMALDGKLQVITFTSFNEGAGKTFISRNLAKTLAQAGKRVVLVDLDVRKGTLSRHFRGHRIGVTDYLADSTMSVEGLIQQSEHFDFVAAGTSAPNPAELLMSNRLDQLIGELRGRYDYIVTDNVPVGIIADATIANRVADVTLFVARIGNFDRRQIPDVELLYSEGKLRNMALVLNGAELSRRYGYYGSYGYYGHYGYGYSYYGYGSKKKKSKKSRLKAAAKKAKSLTTAP